jgi:hypothetical protein
MIHSTYTMVNKTVIRLRLLLLACSLAGLDSFQAPTVVSRVSRMTTVAPVPWQCSPAAGFSLSTTRHHCPRWTLQTLQQGRSSKTLLTAFLPPGGGGDKKSQLGELATTILSFLAIAAFFISPLGGLFFALFNSLLALAILVPIGAIAAFNVWQYFNTVTGPCPSCGFPVKAMKDESPSFCFNCGAIVQAKDDTIYLANPTNIEMMDDEDGNVFAMWMDELSGVRRTPVDEDQRPNIKSTKTTIIDVDVERDDK